MIAVPLLIFVLFVARSYIFKCRYELTWYEAFCETIDWIAGGMR